VGNRGAGTEFIEAEIASNRLDELSASLTWATLSICQGSVSQAAPPFAPSPLGAGPAAAIELVYDRRQLFANAAIAASRVAA
jgi:hypothetical protein